MDSRSLFKRFAPDAFLVFDQLGCGADDPSRDLRHGEKDKHQIEIQDERTDCCGLALRWRVFKFKLEVAQELQVAEDEQQEDQNDYRTASLQRKRAVHEAVDGDGNKNADTGVDRQVGKGGQVALCLTSINTDEEK